VSAVRSCREWQLHAAGPRRIFCKVDVFRRNDEVRRRFPTRCRLEHDARVATFSYR